MGPIDNSARWRRAVVLLLTVATFFAGGAFTLELADDDGDGAIDGGTISYRPAKPKPTPVPGVQAVQPDANNEQSVQEQAKGENATTDAPQVGPAAHEDLRDESPPGVPVESVKAGLTDLDAEGKTGPRPVGGAQNYRCTYKPVGNQSSRNGQKPLLAVLHYTVSRNRPGTSDVYAIRNLFNSLAFGASSTYVIDFEGNCLKLMPESAKPWTQGNFNGRSISVEIIAYGDETAKQWQASRLIKNGVLASLWRDVMRRNGLPLRLVNPVGCGVQRAGWTDHNRLECGNDHHDVTPNFPYLLFQRQLTLGGITDTDVITCRKLNAWRRAGRPTGGQWEKNSVRRRKALESRGVTCTSRGPRR
jgi:N-acetylmuramoyl-L-alanine amidase